MIPYKTVKTQNFRSLLSFARFIAVGGSLSLLMVLVAIAIETYNSGMDTQLAIVSVTVAPIVVIAISGVLAILISMEENARAASENSVSSSET